MSEPHGAAICGRRSGQGRRSEHAARHRERGDSGAYGEQEAVVGPLAARVRVERCTHLTQEVDVAPCLRIVLWVLVVDVETVKPKVFEQPDGRRHELGAQGRIDDYGMEARRVGPAADREEDLEVAVLLLEVVDRLEVAVQVLALVIP